MSWRRLLRNIDYPLVIIVLAILAYSLVVLSSAAANISSDSFYYVRRQLLWILLGGVVFVLALGQNLANLARYRRAIYVANLGLLLLVLVIGARVNGAQSWIPIGPFLFQPSEFSKVLMILAFASFLGERKNSLNTIGGLLVSFLYFVPPMILIMKQPDLGTAMVFFGIIFGMLFVAGAKPNLLAGILGFGMGAIVLVLVGHLKWGWKLPLEEYQIMRLMIFLNPYQDPQGSGYHVIQSEIAIGSGGLLGKGLYQGSQVQLNFLPEQHTDFIFTVVGEELGFAGAVLLLFLYFLLLYRCLVIAGQSGDTLGSLIAAGVASMFLFHLLVNIGMTIGMMPITGIPLPLFSYGGSSMIASLAALGLTLNVHANRRKLVF